MSISEAACSQYCTAVGLLVMMYPILCKVQYEMLHRVFRSRDIWIQISFSIFLNWIIAPFLMVSIIVSCHVRYVVRFGLLTYKSLHWRGHSCPTSLVSEKA